MEKYKESLKSNTVALSALHGLLQVRTMDDRQLNKRVDQLLTTVEIDRAKTCWSKWCETSDEAKVIERRCDVLMGGGGGKMTLSVLQTMMRVDALIGRRVKEVISMNDGENDASTFVTVL